MMRRVAEQSFVWVTLLGIVTLGGCVTEPPRQVAVPQRPPPDTNVYFYPAQGHPALSPERQDRDRFECNTAAVRSSGFDPSLPNVAPQQRVQFLGGGAPPGTGVAVGAVSGAVVGAAVSNPWHAGTGTLFGALAGAAIGGVVDLERGAQTDRLQAQANAQAAALDNKASDYRRAMSACLEGRGYIVR